MDQISVLAAAGMQARMQSLDLVANNMANASTNGYKGDSEFYSVFTSEAADDDGSGVPTTLPMIQRQWTDLSQGLLEPTNNPADFALSGKGFFVVTGPSGPLYTRSGSFKVASSGTLASSDGYPVLAQGGAPINADATQPIEISQDGTVSQGGQSLGQLQLVDFNDPSALVKQGNNYFRNTSSQAPNDASDVQVYQGKVEASNVSAAHSAVRLVGLTRQFEMLQKAISLAGDMNKKAIEEVAKV
jgi:flagellar basal-body rod protein FlgF